MGRPVVFSSLGRERESSSAIRGAQQHGTTNPLAVRCISHPMNRFVLPPSTSETLHCVVAQLPALIVNGNDSAAMTADRKEEKEEKRPQRKCDKSRAPVKFVNWLLSRQQPFLFFFFYVGAFAAAHYYII